MPAVRQALKVSNSTHYSEGHHLRPLGADHGGRDVRSNIIILCPDCHALLDLAAVSLDRNRLYHHPDHSLDIESIEYHNQLVRQRDA